MDKIQRITPLESIEQLAEAIDLLNNGMMQESMTTWYELAYLRFIIIEIVNANPELAKNFKDELTVKARKSAQEYVRTLFSNQKINFGEPDPVGENEVI